MASPRQICHLAPKAYPTPRFRRQGYAFPDANALSGRPAGTLSGSSGVCLPKQDRRRGLPPPPHLSVATLYITVVLSTLFPTPAKTPAYCHRTTAHDICFLQRDISTVAAAQCQPFHSARFVPPGGGRIPSSTTPARPCSAPQRSAESARNLYSASIHCSPARI